MSVMPVRLLKGTLLSADPESYWTEDDGTGDPWIGTPYRYTVNIQIVSSAHASHLSETAFAYTGKDVKVGDWIATSAANGMALQIISITNQEYNIVQAVVEDVERYNVFADPTLSGQAIGQTGFCVIFQLDDEGMPMLGPLTQSDMPFTFVNDLESRFRSRNLALSYVQVMQPNHNMAVGNVISPDVNNSGHYIKTGADSNVDSGIGIVTSINTPSPGYFTFKPIGKLLNNVTPPLVGKHGDMFYLDPANPGRLTNIRPGNNARAIYMRLDRANRAILVDRNNSDDGETRRYEVDAVDNQTVYQMPVGTTEVLYMSINGIENDNYTFDELTGVLTFDASSTGYGVEASDEVFFIYKS